MKMIFRLKTSRKVLGSVIFVCIGFYVMGILGNAYSRHILLEQMLGSLDAQAAYMQSRMEQDIDSLLKIQNTVLIDLNTSKLNVLWGGAGNYENTLLIKRISGRLSEIKEMYTIVDKAEMYYPRKGIVISDSQPIMRHYEGDNYYDYRMINADEEEGIVFTSYFPVQALKGERKNAAYYCRITLSPESLNHTLNDMLGEGEESIYLLSEEGNMLSGSGGNFVETEADTVRLEAVRAYLADHKDAQAFRVRGEELGSCIYSARTGIWIVYFCPDSVISRSLSFFLLLNAGLTLLVIVLFLSYTFYVERKLVKPMDRIIDAMEDRNNHYFIEEDETDELAVIYKRYNQVISHVEELSRENMEMKYQARLAEFRQLQYQIRPHFLYNSIFMIYRMARAEENETIASFARHLSKYYQYITRTNDCFVSLEQEIEHINDYLEIQKARFGERIHVFMEPVPDKAKDLKIIPLILQPLVENAYEHGMKNCLEGGMIRIRTDYQDGYFSFCVEDNGDGLKEDELMELKRKISIEEINSEEIHGLANTNARIRRWYKGKSGLYVDNREDGGFLALVNILVEDIYVQSSGGG